MLSHASITLSQYPFPLTRVFIFQDSDLYAPESQSTALRSTESLSLQEPLRIRKLTQARYCPETCSQCLDKPPRCCNACSSLQRTAEWPCSWLSHLVLLHPQQTSVKGSGVEIMLCCWNYLSSLMELDFPECLMPWPLWARMVPIQCKCLTCAC